MQFFKKKYLLTMFSSCVIMSSYSQSIQQIHEPVEHPFYVGGLGGYGSTTWAGLVPSQEKQNPAMSISMPIATTEGGGMYGGFFGYEFSNYFALEATYLHFPTATVAFDEESLFAFDHEDHTSFSTKTETASLIAKIMLNLPKTTVKAYSGFGIADVHRHDELKNQWRISPTFDIGLAYNVTPRILTEVTANYTAGYGESELNPVDDYIPFLYSVVFRVAIRLG